MPAALEEPTMSNISVTCSVVSDTTHQGDFFGPAIIFFTPAVRSDLRPRQCWWSVGFAVGQGVIQMEWLAGTLELELGLVILECHYCLDEIHLKYLEKTLF